MDQKKCTKCGDEYPVNKDYFGHTPSGGFRNTCRKCMRKHVAEHSANNPDLVKARQEKRRKTIEEQTTFAITVSQVAVLRESLGDRCEYCGLKLEGKGELEHKVPISRGGESSLDNITLACFLCNKEKHNKTPEEFTAWRRKLGLPLNAGNFSKANWRTNKQEDTTFESIREVRESPELKKVKTNCITLMALVVVSSSFLAIFVAN